MQMNNACADVECAACGRTAAHCSFLCRRLPFFILSFSVCAGGLLAVPLLFDAVQSGVHAFLPRASLVRPSLSPDEGAALLAKAQWEEATKPAL